MLSRTGLLIVLALVALFLAGCSSSSDSVEVAEGEKAESAKSLGKEAITRRVGISEKIAFVLRDKTGRAIYMMDADGSNQTRLTTNSPNGDYHPSLSPDGSKITFSHDPDGSWGTEIYVMDVDGSNRTRLTNTKKSDFRPAWSPDGSKIAFESERNEPDSPFAEIYVMDADGSNVIRLTNNDGLDSHPSWSPDGSKIAFQSKGDIYVMNADGSDKDWDHINLTNSWSESEVRDESPSWSPDGSKIAFASHGGNTTPTNEIYVIDTDGSNQTRLTNNDADDKDPSWSPDGLKIAFTSDRDGTHSEIYVMDSDGSNQTRLTNNDLLGYKYDPDWGPAR